MGRPRNPVRPGEVLEKEFPLPGARPVLDAVGILQRFPQCRRQIFANNGFV